MKTKWWVTIFFKQTRQCLSFVPTFFLLKKKKKRFCSKNVEHVTLIIFNRVMEVGPTRRELRFESHGRCVGNDGPPGPPWSWGRIRAVYLGSNHASVKFLFFFFLNKLIHRRIWGSRYCIRVMLMKMKMHVTRWNWQLRCL